MFFAYSVQAATLVLIGDGWCSPFEAFIFRFWSWPYVGEITVTRAHIQLLHVSLIPAAVRLLCCHGDAVCCCRESRTVRR